MLEQFAIWMSEISAGVWIVISVLGLIVFMLYRENARHRSLHRREDGMFVWTEWHGKECESLVDPSGPGGAWSSGDGGGGDGGGGD